MKTKQNKVLIRTWHQYSFGKAEGKFNYIDIDITSSTKSIPIKQTTPCI